MHKKSRSKQASKIEFLEEQAINNARAMAEGPKRKKWTIHDMIDIKALTPPQEDMVHSYIDGNNVVAHGSAGTGKSLMALALAFWDVFSKDTRTDHIIIVRSTVSARDMGFLPGTEEEKMAPFERPYLELVAKLFKKKMQTYENMKEAGLVEFTSTSFVRGLTWDNAIVIVDEIQNMNWEELNSVMTRLGDNSRIIALGDYVQNDLHRSKYDQSGIEKFLRIVQRIDGFDLVKFTKHDILRSEFVKKWICAAEDDGPN